MTDIGTENMDRFQFYFYTLVLRYGVLGVYHLGILKFSILSHRRGDVKICHEFIWFAAKIEMHETCVSYCNGKISFMCVNRVSLCEMNMNGLFA